jgi:hypothetical protein
MGTRFRMREDTRQEEALVDLDALFVLLGKLALHRDLLSRGRQARHGGRIERELLDADKTAVVLRQGPIERLGVELEKPVARLPALRGDEVGRPRLGCATFGLRWKPRNKLAAGEPEVRARRRVAAIVAGEIRLTSEPIRRGLGGEPGLLEEPLRGRVRRALHD